MASNQLIKVNGLDVSSKRMSSKIEHLYQDKIDMAVITFRFDVNDLIVFEKFQDVTIWEASSGTLEQDSNRKFNGNIAKIERDVGRVIITAYSFLWKAIQSEINQTYDKNIDASAGEGSEIFIDIAGQCGITADNTTVEATGTSPGNIILDKFVCNRVEGFDRMQTLADIYNYQFYERYDDLKLYFQPVGFESNLNVIFIGGENNNVQGFPKWTDDNTKFFNKVEILGFFQEVRKTETFDGNASETEFVLTNEPETVEVRVGGDLQIGGISGVTETFDYEVDISNKKIIFQVASTPGSGTDNISVDYSYKEPRSVIRENESSISEIAEKTGGTGIIKNRFTFSDIQSLDDAERRGDNLLSVYSKEFKFTKVFVKPSFAESANLLVGQSIRVIDTRQNFDFTMVIKKIISRFPENDVELELGDREIRTSAFEFDTELRLKRLEEELSKSGDIVRVVKDPKHTLIVDRRDLDITTSEYDGGSGVSIFGLGSADGFFDWGSGKWGTHDDAFLDEVTGSISQGRNIYDEDFNDIDYKDAVNTTATNWGSDSIQFTSGQVAQSSSFDFNNGTILTARLISTEVSGSFDYELSADGGSNWEVVTSGTKHIFTNTGDDLRFRITENSASTGEISNIKIDEYH